MASTSHYLYKERAILFQATAGIGSATGAVASYALKTYTDRETLVKSLGGTLRSTDISAAGGIVVASGALGGTATGLVFLVLMFRPGHGETKKSVLLKEVGFGILVLFGFVAAMVATIITASQSASIDTAGLSDATRATIQAQLGSLRYRDSPATLAFTILSWFAFVLLASSAVLVHKAARHVLHNGPNSNASVALPQRLFSRYFGRKERKEGLVQEEELTSA